MKRIVLFAILVIATQSLSAQSVKFGVKGGVSLPTISESPYAQDGNNKNTIVKFLIGGYSSIKFGKFGVEPGVLLSWKGVQSKTDDQLSSYGLTVPYQKVHSTNIMYLEIPVNGVYYIPVKLGSFYFGAGPYAAIALSGKHKNKDKRDIYVKKVTAQEIAFGSAQDQLKSSDFGVNGLAGIQMKNGLNLGVNYGLGLSDINNTAGVNSYNRAFSLNVGYQF